MKKHNIFLFTFLLILCCGCTKDKINSSGCTELEKPSGIHFEIFYENKLPYYYYPCFNPNNSSEIVFIRADGLDTTRLFKIDLITKEKVEIFKGFINSRPRWSKKDWIIFGLQDFNVYKIKSNGDSLTQLTVSGNSFGPEWNKEGDLFIYEEGYTSPVRGIVCETDGTVIDTIVGGGAYSPSWQHDSLIAHSNPLEVFTINPITHEIKTVFEVIDDRGNSGGVEWIDNETIIWSYQKGIFTTNINTKETIYLKESCDAKLYVFPTYSPQSGKIIYQRIDKYQRGEDAGKAISKLYIMNSDATGEEEIEIPE